MKTSQMVAFVLENQAPAQAKKSQEVFGSAIKTAARILEEWYTSILDTFNEEEKNGRVKYTFVIDGKTVTTPWIFDKDNECVTTDQWKSFFRSYSKGTVKLFIANRNMIVTVTDGVVTYPEGYSISVSELYAANGILWNSLADLIEYALSGRVTDLSIAAKHQNVWDARRAVLRDVEQVKAQEKYDRQFRAYFKQLGRNAARK